jgi:hypothetical protein
MRLHPLESPRMVYHALNYARRGLRVFPIYEPVMGACSCGDPNCSSPAKHPRNAHGVSEATSDPKIICGWWTQWPDANIGIEAKDMIVLDVDPRKGGNESISTLKKELGLLPPSWRSLTGGDGEHDFFRRNGANAKNGTNLREGIDLKTDAGYLVASPSLHISGKRYKWDANCSRMLAELPKHWIDFIAQCGKKGERDRKEKFDTASALKGVPEGKRDETCFKLACKLRNADVPFNMALGLILEAAQNCTPPFPEDIARKKAENAYKRYEPASETPREKTEFQYIEFASSFLTVEDPPIEYLIDEILPEGVINVDHGDPRTRKSWAALETTIAIATGTPAFGMERFKASKAVPVLYSSQEDAAPLVRLRTKAILRGRSITSWPETLAFSVHKGINLESPEWHEALLRDILRYGFKLVILDPIRRYAPNADKGPAEVGEITKFLRRLTVETGATIKIVHHDVKPKADNRDDRRRSHKASGGDWFAAAECPIAFEPAGDDRTLVIPEDYKLSTDPQPFSFRLETDDPRAPTWARLIGESASADDAKLLAMQQKILSYLAEHPAGDSGNAIAKAIHIRKEDVYTALNKLLLSDAVDAFGERGQGKKQTWFLKQKEQK